MSSHGSVLNQTMILTGSTLTFIEWGFFRLLRFRTRPDFVELVPIFAKLRCRETNSKDLFGLVYIDNLGNFSNCIVYSKQCDKQIYFDVEVINKQIRIFYIISVTY